MLLEKLTEYYGLPGEVEAGFITEHLEGYTPEDEKKLYEETLAQRTKRFGFPDVAFLTKLFEKFPPASKATGKVLWWNVCENCGCEYMGNLTCCPRCWRNGYTCRQVRVRKGYSIPDTVVRLNKPYTSSFKDDPSCYDCVHCGSHYCRFFGRPEHDCKQRNECPCNHCCMKAVSEARESQYEVKTVTVKPRKVS
ncbi:hypothetical protein [Treponema sp.]|uniref:hypothetical protein n=1 Tax=Treponema sp. TaxID=166 RepID=UPI0025D4472F|nr:hypothetical protein [Treponema sp.]MCR5218601.1 hypothetical protein [Treponema sp.]